MREKKDQVDVLELVDGGHHQGSHEVGLQIMMHWYRSEMQNMAQDAQRKCNCQFRDVNMHNFCTCSIFQAVH